MGGPAATTYLLLSTSGHGFRLRRCSWVQRSVLLRRSRTSPGGVSVTLAGAKLPVMETQEVHWMGTHALCLRAQSAPAPRSPPVLPALGRLSGKHRARGLNLLLGLWQLRPPVGVAGKG